MSPPIDRLTVALRGSGLSRLVDQFARQFPDDHLKDMVVDAAGPGRTIEVDGRRVTNFGSDSFLGLDCDPRVQRTVEDGVRRWGTHNGSSRAFASVRSNIEAEEKLAAWLGTGASLIYPSVTLANLGAIPGLVGKRDFVAFDEFAHNSMQEGIKIARANGTAAGRFRHNDPADLERVLQTARPYNFALVCVDGVYSMGGDMPPLRDLAGVASANDAVMYVDDAHGTGVLGEHGRGTVLEALGSYDNTLVIGSLSKAFSCFGGFIGCTAEMQLQLKIRSNSYVFGGPVPPPYLDAICTVVDILTSLDYPRLRAALDRNLRRLTAGAVALGLDVIGGQTPIVSILVGDEGDTLRAGRFLFDRGYYVQSVLFPAVPYRAGVLRIQVNANHTPAEVGGLLEVLRALTREMNLPGPSKTRQLQAA
ncbi:MAG TPA: pyridoxal phosphate-dependent aminotransferase family protein [Gemmataceae bacterium]|nr:pyridoxal phosphate-dependent aminotransferase family protein [Gemmataceae bacterium]